MATPKAPLTRAQFALMTTTSVAFSLVWSLLCNLVIEYLYTGFDTRSLLVVTLGSRFLVFLLGGTLTWFLFLVLWATTARLRVPTAAILAVAILLGYANYKKATLRLEPLYPSDFKFASNVSFLSQMVSLSALAGLVTVVGLLLLVTLLIARILGRTWRRTDRRHHPRRWLLVVTTRVVALLVSVAVLGYATQFNESGNRVRKAYEAGGATWAFWFQKLNYRNNGFVGGMLYNLDVPAMRRPAGYSRANMDRIVDRYTVRAAELNKEHDEGALDDVNIVLVLSEAFSDPENLQGVDFVEDPIPNTRRVMESTTSGEMLAQLFGGGTANMEFEVLSGMSLSQFNPQMQTPYQMLLEKYDSFPSAVGYLAAGGHKPIAIHPYMTAMYKREVVYPILGFEEFLGEDEIADPERIEDGRFISDAASLDQVEREIAKSEAPLLVNLVTMQNHYPMKGQYDDPLTVRGVEGEPREQAEDYGRGLRHTDIALRSFLDALEQSNEKTAVVFYGDHLPAFWPAEVRDRNGELAMRKTPFFLWANSGMDVDQSMPTTSPIYFLPLLFNALDAELPPYYALLLELHQVLPAMEQGIFLDQAGRDRSLSELSPTARALLHDYRLVQYDLSVGRRYSQDGLFYPEAAASAAGEQP